MWCASVCRLTPGICLASAAIRSSFVETVIRLGVPPIFPPHGSMTRQRLPSVGSLGRLSPLHRYYALLRLLVTRLDSPWLPLVPRYRPKKNFSRKCRDLPGSWVTLCTYAALSDPGRIFVPNHEDEPTRGVAVPDDFRPATHVAGASVRTVSLSRGTSMPPPLWSTSRAPAT